MNKLEISSYDFHKTGKGKLYYFQSTMFPIKNLWTKFYKHTINNKSNLSLNESKGTLILIKVTSSGLKV